MHVGRKTYLVGESLHQNGHQKVEEDVVAEGHESDEIQRCPMVRLFHAKKEDNVPILLSQDL